MKSVKKSLVYVALPYAFASSFVVCLVITICNLMAREKCVTEGDNNKPAASDFNSTGTYCIVRMKKKKKVESGKKCFHFGQLKKQYTVS